MHSIKVEVSLYDPGKFPVSSTAYSCKPGEINNCELKHSNNCELKKVAILPPDRKKITIFETPERSGS
jgi:hypothetical protein